MKRTLSKLILASLGSVMLFLFQNATSVEPEDSKMILGAAIHMPYNQPTIAQSLTDAQEAAKEDFYLGRFLSGGMNSFRTDYTWAAVEQEPGIYKPVMNGTEQIIQKAPARNMSSLVILGGSNKYYGGGYPTTSSEIEGFINYSKSLTTRLSSTTKYFEIWNEWYQGTGMPLDRQDRKLMKDPVYYANLIKATVKAVKAVNPKAILMAGSQGLSEGESAWYQGLAQNGAFDSIDGISFHTYNYGQRKFKDPNLTTLTKLDQMHETLLKMTKRTSLDFYITEVGWPNYIQKQSQGDDISYDAEYELTEQEAGNRMTRFLLLAKTKPYLKGIWIYSLTNVCTREFDRECHFGMIDFNRSKWNVNEYWKKSYVGVKNIADLITDSKVIDSKVAEDGSAAIVYQSPTGFALALWRMEDGAREKSPDWGKLPAGFVKQGSVAVLDLDKNPSAKIPTEINSSMPWIIRSKYPLIIPEGFLNRNYKITLEKNKPYAIPGQSNGVLQLTTVGDLTLSITGQTLWNAGTRCTNCAVGLQDNGNILLYDKKTGATIWSTGTYGHRYSRLVASTEQPYLRIVDGSGIVWASSTRFENFSLTKGQSIRVGASSASPDSVLTMQMDGKLALTSSSGRILWTSTVECPDCWLLMQGGSRGDGNMVLRSGGVPKWNSASWGHKNAALEISVSEPYLKIVSDEGVLWSSSAKFSALSLNSNQIINVGESAQYPEAVLKLQDDGDLVLSRQGKKLWSSNTAGACKTCTATMQGDGNFVLRDGSGQPYYDTRTWGPRKRGSYLQISSKEPYLRIADESGVLWSSSMNFGRFRLLPNQFLNIGSNGTNPTLLLKNEWNGEMVLYQGTSTNVLWRSGAICATTHFCYANMNGDEGDGNLFSVAQPKTTGTSYVLYATQTFDETGRYDRGTTMKFSTREPYMKIVDDTGIIWASSKKFTDLSLTSGKRIKIGPHANIPEMTLVLQDDGNLVLYRGKNAGVLWQSGTAGMCKRCHLNLQGDGNLVLYSDESGAAVFATKTWGHPGASVEFSTSPPYMKVIHPRDGTLWSAVK